MVLAAVIAFTFAISASSCLKTDAGLGKVGKISDIGSVPPSVPNAGPGPSAGGIRIEESGEGGRGSVQGVGSLEASRINIGGSFGKTRAASPNFIVKGGVSAGTL